MQGRAGEVNCRSEGHCHRGYGKSEALLCGASFCLAEASLARSVSDDLKAGANGWIACANATNAESLQEGVTLGRRIGRPGQVVSELSHGAASRVGEHDLTCGRRGSGCAAEKAGREYRRTEDAHEGPFLGMSPPAAVASPEAVTNGNSLARGTRSVDLAFRRAGWTEPDAIQGERRLRRGSRQLRFQFVLRRSAAKRRDRGQLRARSFPRSADRILRRAR
jgi:hypothetical protein